MNKYILILFTLGLFSCTSVLDVDPFSKILPKEYSHFQDLDNHIHLTSVPPQLKLERRTDNVSFYLNGSKGNDDQYLYHDTEIFASDWNTLYSLIVSANLIIDKVDACEAPKADKDYLKADALVVRANYYFYLVNIFSWHYDKATSTEANSGVPINLGYSMRDKGYARATTEEVYQRILTDLKDAEELFLSEEETLQRPNEYHHSLNSLYALKSRVLLYMQNWEEAQAVAEKAWKINSEIKDMSVLDVDAEDKVWMDYTVALYKFGGPFNVLTNAMTSFVLEDKMLASYADTDKRIAFYKPVKTQQDVTKKLFTDFKYDGAELEYGNPVSMIRNAEVLLNKAEANARMAINGKTECLAKAIIDLNLLKQNRIEGYTEVTEADFTNAQEVLDEILKERRRELAFEGFRWFDLKRSGYPEIVHAWVEGNKVLEQNDFRYVILIPTDELSANTLIKQNKRK